MNFGVCDFSRFALTDWRLRRWRLLFLALMTATLWDALKSPKNRKRQRRKRESVTAKREKSQTPKFVTAILT